MIVQVLVAQRQSSDTLTQQLFHTVFNQTCIARIAEQQAALRKFQALVDSLPDQDARPLYEPRAPNPWDK
jgi:hypothetical protein